LRFDLSRAAPFRLVQELSFHPAAAEVAPCRLGEENQATLDLPVSFDHEYYYDFSNGTRTDEE
jgi:hypothetical protein